MIQLKLQVERLSEVSAPDPDKRAVAVVDHWARSGKQADRRGKVKTIVAVVFADVDGRNGTAHSRERDILPMDVSDAGLQAR